VRPFALVALVLVAAGCGGSGAVVEHPATTRAARLAGAELRPPRAAPPLALRDEDGRPYSLRARRGQWTLVTFLYTHCPDVCPLIASNLNTALRTLGAKADVGVLAVSVDPVGDTPAAVRAYRRRMHLVSRFHYLIGTRAHLLPVWRAWHVLAVLRKPDVVDHVAYTALVDPSGKERVVYDARVQAQQIVHDFRLLLREKSAA
jgi:protein SCO1/2